MFTPEGIRLHIDHKLEVQACLVFAQYAIYWRVFVLDTRICVENMAEILSVCEDTETCFMVWKLMDNVEELYNQKIGFWDRNGGIHGTC